MSTNYLAYSGRKALIYGVTGQDGSYLSELLLSKGYQVVGVKRRASVDNCQRLHTLIGQDRFRVFDGDVTDALSVARVIEGLRPSEVYNLAAQSDVRISFEEPAHTWAVTAGGCLNILEAIRNMEARRKAGEERIRFYQASSSEMFGTGCSRYDDVDLYDDPNSRRSRSDYRTRPAGFHPGHYYKELFQDELTPMLPRSPYAIAKLAAHYACQLYRDSYGVFACSGILFNHESERRGENFVTRKITQYVAAVRKGKAAGPLKLGNLDACRDWGHAQDYVRGMWMMCQQPRAADYVLATGETHSVLDFLKAAYAAAKLPEPVEDRDFAIDKSLFRPSEVPLLKGDYSKAKTILGWKPYINFGELVRRMVESDIARA